MSTNTDPRPQIIEDAHLDDVQPGDHLTRVQVMELGSLTRTVRREGVAHHRDQRGGWYTEDDVWIVGGEGETEAAKVTITIRRPAQPLPPERDGVVLVPAGGHKTITTTDGQEFTRLTFTTKQSIWYGPNLAARPGDLVIQTTTPSRLTPGVWKVDDQ